MLEIGRGRDGGGIYGDGWRIEGEERGRFYGDIISCQSL